MLVLILFFCSGATALVYEVLWSKYLSLMLGSTVQAQTVVLAVFMGGLALGNSLFGKRADHLKQPLAVYGFLEMAIGLFAFLFYYIYQAADFVFVKLGSSIFEWSALLLCLKLAISVILLILPTVLMGGTLPLLASWLQKQPNLDWSSQVSVFYAINSFGAVVGAACAGFLLVQSFGMISSLQIVAFCNLIIGLAALVLSRREMGLIASQGRNVGAKPSAATDTGWPWLALLVAATGGVSMGLEVVSSRALALIAGGSIQAFALVLMSFIFGIGIGSFFISSSKIARRLGVRTIYLLLLSAATIVGTNMIFIEEWVIVYSHARYGLAMNLSGYIWYQCFIALLSFVVLGLPAAFLGATVPLSVILLEACGSSGAMNVGRLLTGNTLGAVSGVLITGFLLMPLLGIRGTLATLSFVLLAVATVIATKQQNRSITYISGAIGLLLLVGISSTGEHWRHVLGSGVFRARGGPVTAEKLKGLRAQELLYYKDAPDATVSVERAGLETGRAQLFLRINGKPDASSHGDLPTQYLLAHLPMMARPDAKRAFVLGFGSGITAGALLGHPIEKLTIAENCGPVLEAAHFFGEWNRGVLTNSHTEIRKEDARAVLKLSKEKYDVIISEPSNPWVAGIGAVFSQDFYQLAADKLVEGGIMAQWFHCYEMDDAIVFMVIRTFASVFPYLEIWDTENGDIVLLGSKNPWPSGVKQFAKVFERAQPKKDLELIKMSSPERLYVRQIASQRTAFAIAGDGPVQTDEFPILEYSAPKAFFIGTSATELYGFDERTWQWPLAPTDKITALQSLSPEALVETIEEWKSSNQELNLYSGYLKRGGIGPIREIDSRSQIIVRPPSTYPEKVELPPTASNEYKELTDLELQVLRNPSEAKTKLPAIEKVLIEMVSKDKLSADFSPQFYAALGARFAMRDGDYLQALRFLRLGMVFAPEGAQLLYLSRVLDRMMPPEVMEKLKSQESARSTNRVATHP